MALTKTTIIEIRAYDVAKNVKSWTLTIVVDTEKPTIEITEPRELRYRSPKVYTKTPQDRNRFFHLEGLVDDDVNVKKVTVNGGEAQLTRQEDGRYLFVSEVYLKSATSTESFDIYAYDNADNRGELQVTFE